MTDKNSCNDLSGRVAPVVNRNRCEGKEECVIVCPYNVFEIGTLSKAQRSELSFRGKLKALGHGGRQAFVVNPEACHACNLCVEVCPEKALSLQALVS